MEEQQLEGDTRNGGIVLIGSHVKKTTDQLNCLKELDGQVDFMEFQVNTVFEENGLEKEVEKTVKAAEEKILSGRTVVIYTSRQLLAPENMSSGRETADFCKDFQRSDQYYRKTFCEAEIYHCKRRNRLHLT